MTTARNSTWRPEREADARAHGLVGRMHGVDHGRDHASGEPADQRTEAVAGQHGANVIIVAGRRRSGHGSDVLQHLIDRDGRDHGKIRQCERHGAPRFRRGGEGKLERQPGPRGMHISDGEGHRKRDDPGREERRNAPAGDRDVGQHRGKDNGERDQADQRLIEYTLQAAPARDSCTWPRRTPSWQRARE